MTADVCESEITNGNGNGGGAEVEHSERDVTPTTTTSGQDQDQDLAKTNGNTDPKDDFDGSYVFVNGTDAKDKDLHDSDLNLETENETLAIHQPEQPPHNGEFSQLNDHSKIENEMVAIDEQPDQTAQNGDSEAEAEAEAAEFDVNVYKVEGGEDFGDGEAEAETEAEAAEFNVNVDEVERGEGFDEKHDSMTGECKTENETVAIDQPEQPAHNGEFSQLNDDSKIENEMVAMDEQPNQTAQNGDDEAEAEAEPAEFNVNVDKVEGGEVFDEKDYTMTDESKTENETVAIDQPEQPAQAEASEINVEGREEIHETHDCVINSDLAADEKEHQESDIGVNNVESATNQEQEEAESFNEVSLAADLEQDLTIAPCPETEVKSDLVINNIPASDEGLPAAVPEQEAASESLLVRGNSAEQNGSSESLPTPLICGDASRADIGPASPTAVDNEQPLIFSEEAPVEASQGDNGAGLEHSLETPSCSEVDKTIEIEASNGPLYEEIGEALPAGLAQESISETLVITDLVDASQNAPEQDETSGNVGSLTTPSLSCNVLESGESFPDDAPVIKIKENSDVENKVSLPAGALPISDVEDVRPETDTEKSNQRNIENPESCPSVENENIPVDPESIFPANDVRSQTQTCSASSEVEEKLSTDAVDVESENSNGAGPECAGSQLMSCSQTDGESVSHIITSVDHYSSSPASLVAAEVKLESEVENASVVRGKDMPSDAVLALEGEDSDAKSDVQLTSQEVGSIDGNQKDEASTSFPEDSSEGQNVGVEVVKRPFYFFIRIPRCDDEKLREEIKLAQLQVEQRTKSRDAIRAQIHMKRVRNFCK